MCFPGFRVWKNRLSILFHVEHIPIYLPKKTKSTLISAGETPLIREACEMVTGRMDCSFSLASWESDLSLV